MGNIRTIATRTEGRSTAHIHLLLDANLIKATPSLNDLTSKEKQRLSAYTHQKIQLSGIHTDVITSQRQSAETYHLATKEFADKVNEPRIKEDIVRRLATNGTAIEEAKAFARETKTKINHISSERIKLMKQEQTPTVLAEFKQLGIEVQRLAATIEMKKQATSLLAQESARLYRITLSAQPNDNERLAMQAYVESTRRAGMGG